MFRGFNKNIIVNKSIYAIVDGMRLQAYINRIDRNNYDINIIDNEKRYKIIVTPKIERS